MSALSLRIPNRWMYIYVYNIFCVGNEKESKQIGLYFLIKILDFDYLYGIGPCIAKGFDVSARRGGVVD